MALSEGKQVFSVSALHEWLGKKFQLGTVYPALAIGNFFYASNFKPLPFFDGLHESRSLHEGREGSGIEPSCSAVKNAYREFALSQVFGIYVGNFVFSAGARF